MTVLAIAAWAIEPHAGINSSAAAIVATVFLFVYNSFFGIGWLGMSWVVVRVSKSSSCPKLTSWYRWLYAAEIVPLEVRAAATGLSTASSKYSYPEGFSRFSVLESLLRAQTHTTFRLPIDWIFNFLIVLITPISFENIGWKTCEFISSLLVFFYIIISLMPALDYWIQMSYLRQSTSSLFPWYTCSSQRQQIEP